MNTHRFNHFLAISNKLENLSVSRRTKYSGKNLRANFAKLLITTGA